MKGIAKNTSNSVKAVTLDTTNRKKRVCLTGISGSIGVHVMHHIFKNTDWEIVGIATFQHKGIAERITEMMQNHIENWPRLTLITHDLTKPFTKVVKDKIGKIDYILNLASLSDVEASIQEPVPFMRNNIDLMYTMLEYAREAKPEVFVQFSTDEVYGPSGKRQRFVEWAPIIPSNPYSASKAAQEAIAISYWRSYGVPIVITNTMNNFGEFQQPSKYPVIIQKKVMEGKKLTVHGSEGNIGTRYYIHSRNAADALLFIIKKLPIRLHMDGEVDRPDRYNIVGDEQVDNLSLAKLIAELMDKPLKYELQDVHKNRPGHDRHYGLDGTKLKKKGWKSPMPFKESLKNTIEWQVENEYWIS